MRINQSRVKLNNFYAQGIVVKADVPTGQKVVKKRNGVKRVVGVKGFGVDVNADGKINGAQDGFLAFADKNGNYNIRQANRLLTAFAGDFDLNDNGKVTKEERQRGRLLRQQARGLDLDKDGVLSNWELNRAGAAVVDKDGRPVMDIEPQSTLSRDPRSPEAQQRAEHQRQMEMFQRNLALQNFGTMFQSLMMSLSNMYFAGPFGGYPPSLALPIY